MWLISKESELKIFSSEFSNKHCLQAAGTPELHVTLGDDDGRLLGEEGPEKNQKRYWENVYFALGSESVFRLLHYKKNAPTNGELQRPQ